MGAGAGRMGGMPQQMPQQMATGQAMPQGVPAQSNKGGLGALAAQMQQGGQADPRLMAMMQAFQQQSGMPTQQTQQAMQEQGGMPGTGMMPQGGMPTQQAQQGMMDQIRQANPSLGRPQMQVPQMPGMAAPGGGLFPGAQRPLPVGAGGKGTGMPRPGISTPRVMATPRRPGFSGSR